MSGTNYCRETRETMSVQNELETGVKNPTRKQAWSVAGIMLLSAATSFATPFVTSGIKKVISKVKK